MPYLVFRISKFNDSMSQRVQWENHYIMDCDYAVGSDECEQDALKLAHGEATLHLETTQYYMVTVGTFGEQANSEYQATEVAYPLTRSGLRGGRVANDQAPDSIGLFMKKQVRTGKNGRALYFGALNRDDYTEADDGKLVLTNSGEIQYLVDYLLYGLYWSGLIGTLVATQYETPQQTAWDYRPYTLKVGHVSTANARQRAMMRRKERAVGAWSRASGTLWLAATRIQQMREGIALAHDFQDEGFQSWTQSIITGAMEAYDGAKTWVETGEINDDGETVKPVARFGPSFDRIEDMADALQGRAEQDLESVGKIGPYQWFGDQKYTHLEDAKALLDYAVVWQAKIAELVDFDYYTPIYI